MIIFCRDHAYDEDEWNRGAKIRPSSRVSKVEEPAKRPVPVRGHHTTLEGKMLPEARRNISFSKITSKTS